MTFKIWYLVTPTFSITWYLLTPTFSITGQVG